MKKIIVSIIVISLLLTTSMVTVNVVNGKACRPFIYVDDDNTQGPWDGTQEHPYQYVQDGIDNANEGDTIYVFSGFYNEYLTLSKSVRLIGEDRDSTRLNWSIAIEDYIDGITIRGFTLGSQGINLYHSSFHEICDNNFLDLRGVSLVNCSNSIVSNNIIKPFLDCIQIDRSSCNNTISGNYISGGYCGVSMYYYSKDNVVTSNTITNCDRSGITVNYESDDNIFINNTIENNGGYGIDVFVSNNNIISNNIITNNDRDGIDLTHTHNNIISNNIITNNNGTGIDLSYSDNSIASNNIITNNSKSNIHFYGWGIALTFSDNCTISNNSITNNEGSGVYVSSSDNNTVIDNTIADNGKNGIRVSYANYNTFSGNTIVNNSRFGVSFTGPRNEENIYPAYFNTFSGNTIRDNTRFGVYVNKLCLGNFFYYNNFISNDQNAQDEGKINLWYNPIEKEGNYWDDYTGVDRNGDGIGDTPYKIPGKIIQSKDWYPVMDPFDIANLEITEEMTVEESEVLAQLEETINSQILSGELNINDLMNSYMSIVSTPSSIPINS